MIISAIGDQCSRDLSRYGWIHLPATIVKDPGMTVLAISLVETHLDMVGFTYSLQYSRITALAFNPREIHPAMIRFTYNVIVVI
jgi:hypothetical protein